MKAFYLSIFLATSLFSFDRVEIIQSEIVQLKRAIIQLQKENSALRAQKTKVQVIVKEVPLIKYKKIEKVKVLERKFCPDKNIFPHLLMKIE